MAREKLTTVGRNDSKKELTAVARIQVNIKKICQKQGINTAYGLQKAGRFTPTLAYSLFNHSFKQLSLRTLLKLCTTLSCSPADLLVKK